MKWQYYLMLNFAIFNLLDIATTILGLQVGLTEANYLAKIMPLEIFFTVKMLLVLTFCFVYLKIEKFVPLFFRKICDLTLVSVTFFYFIVVMNNCILLLNSI